MTDWRFEQRNAFDEDCSAQSSSSIQHLHRTPLLPRLSTNRFFVGADMLGTARVCVPPHRRLGFAGPARSRWTLSKGAGQPWLVPSPWGAGLRRSVGEAAIDGLGRRRGYGHVRAPHQGRSRIGAAPWHGSSRSSSTTSGLPWLPPSGGARPEEAPATPHTCQHAVTV